MNSRILVVDDDPDILKLISIVLARAGYEVITAMNGSEGLKLARNGRPHLMILDGMLPDIDGNRVCRYLRADPDTANLPILMLTARTLPNDQRAGFEAGADDYLTKPFALSELITRINALFFFTT